MERQPLRGKISFAATLGRAEECFRYARKVGTEGATQQANWNRFKLQNFVNMTKTMADDLALGDVRLLAYII